MRRLQLFGHSLKMSSIELLLGCIVASIMGAVLIYSFQLTPFTYSVIISSSIIYNGMLLILSAILSFIFAYSIQTMHLVTLLKGKVPLKAHFGFPLYLSISCNHCHWSLNSSCQHLWLYLADLSRGK